MLHYETKRSIILHGQDTAYLYGALPQFDLNITDSVDGDKCASILLRLGHEEIEIVLRDKDLA